MRKSVIILLLIFCHSICISSQKLTLFSPEIKQYAPHQQQIVMTFLERYFQELLTQKQTTMESRLADDKVYFRKGKPRDLYHVADTMSFSLSLLDRYYEAQWTVVNEPFITVVFPAQYDLILGMDQSAAQQQFRDAVMAAPQRTNSTAIPNELQLLSDSVYIYKQEHFELESLNDATYYNKVCEGWNPLFECKHLDYSAANLFHDLSPMNDYRMYVEQSIYGLKTISYILPFSQWLNYCADEGLKIYFGVEEQHEDGLLAIVVAQSQEFGFTHLLSVVIPDDFVNNPNVVLKARITPYIPQHNVKDLYQQANKNAKKKIWQ